jgi:hypothetical protein
LDKKRELEKESESKKIISQQRAKALDMAFMATRLLEEKHFDIASKLLNKTKNYS